MLRIIVDLLGAVAVTGVALRLLVAAAESLPALAAWLGRQLLPIVSVLRWLGAFKRPLRGG